MRANLYKAVSSVPAKVFFVTEAIVSFGPTIAPNKFKEWLDWVMTPEQIRLFGVGGIALFFAWLSLCLWLRPVPAQTAKNGGQTASGDGSVAAEGNYGTIETGDSYSVTSTSSGIAIGRVDALHVNQPKFEMTDEVMRLVLKTIDKTRPLALAWKNSGRTPKMVETLRAFLLENGVNIAPGSIEWGNGWPGAEQPITYLPDGFTQGGVSIGGPEQTIYVDADL